MRTLLARTVCSLLLLLPLLGCAPEPREEPVTAAATDSAAGSGLATGESLLEGVRQRRRAEEAVPGLIDGLTAALARVSNAGWFTGWDSGQQGPAILESGSADDLVAGIPGAAFEMVLDGVEPEVRQEVERLYAGQAGNPIFLDPRLGSRPAVALLSFLVASHELGLDPFALGLPRLLEMAGSDCLVGPGPGVAEIEARLAAQDPGGPAPSLALSCLPSWWPPEAVAEPLDVALTLTYVQLTRELGAGAAVPFTGAERAAATLLSLLPVSDRYWGRVAALRRYLGYWQRQDFPVLGRFGTMKQGARGERVARLKRRLAAERFLTAEEAAAAPDRFDAVTARAVRDYRAAYGLSFGAAVDQAMLEELSRPVTHHISLLRRSLQRTLARGEERQPTYLLVNVPEFMTYLVVDGKVASSHRSIVGFPYNEPGGRTPEIDAVVSYIDVNPSWTPTPYVLLNELEPKARTQRDYFANNRFVRRSGKWVQLPGPENTMGQINIAFANDNNISLHGTPEPERFEYQDRALSHGCVRVESIEELTKSILEWSGQDSTTSLDAWVQKVIERRVVLARELPVHIVYDRIRVVGGATTGIARDPYRLAARVEDEGTLRSLKALLALAQNRPQLAAAAD